MKLTNKEGRAKDVPTEKVDKFLAGGWTKAESPAAPVKKAAPKPPKK